MHSLTIPQGACDTGITLFKLSRMFQTAPPEASPFIVEAFPAAPVRVVKNKSFSVTTFIWCITNL